MLNKKPVIDKKHYEFSILDCRLLSAHFEGNKEYVPNSDISINYNLTVKHNYVDAEDMLHLLLNVDVNSQDSPIILAVLYGARFNFEHKPEKPEDIAFIAEINCAAIVFPFMREMIADLTTRAGLPPLLLPPVNFVDFYKNNHKHPDAGVGEV